jgi:hypothetical protein
MKIFVSHATQGNFEEELYIPLQNSKLSEEHEFVFPHEGGEAINVKDVLRDCDLVLAEVSNPTFEQGLELGWANGAYVTTICFYKAGSQPSPFLQEISENVNMYNSFEELVNKVKEAADAI